MSMCLHLCICYLGVSCVHVRGAEAMLKAAIHRCTEIYPDGHVETVLAMHDLGLLPLSPAHLSCPHVSLPIFPLPRPFPPSCVHGKAWNVARMRLAAPAQSNPANRPGSQTMPCARVVGEEERGLVKDLKSECSLARRTCGGDGHGARAVGTDTAHVRWGLTRRTCGGAAACYREANEPGLSFLPHIHTRPPRTTPYPTPTHFHASSSFCVLTPPQPHTPFCW